MSVNKVNSDGSLTRVAGGTLYADAPIGEIHAFGGTTIPSGYLLCDGTAYSRTDFAELFAVIGTAFGSGDDSTTFNVPDLREAVPVGGGTRGSGVTTHDTYDVGTFKDDQIQTHTHTLSHTHSYSGTTSGMSNHSSGYFTPMAWADFVSPDGSTFKLNRYGASRYDANGAGPDYNTAQVTMDVSHTHSYSGTTGGASNSTTSDNTGRTGSTTHGKQLGVNYIIKAKQTAVPLDIKENIKLVVASASDFTDFQSKMAEW